ncbi:phytanoyl-CoA dioxygenase family protein [Thalassobaculum sp. OXR-137]|uniref:phytanoyl-CoA dioxygenase family protein n=1 Tax=Thalassobaculum sp. OXR-137 TaxID=3100173 RepID=UPI002AC9C901|nr:phytanoyl-CoA dioxygenase family protein [Thalassobaculum sp. OXR-137]WPZ36038.1 phytanoyl-CoA dioxygenase family protein [Thalassobaculum sp. OXR-137]
MPAAVASLPVGQSESALAILARDGAVGFPGLLGADTVDALRAGLAAAVEDCATIMRAKGMAPSDAGIAHHVLASDDSFPDLLEDLPAADTIETFLGGNFILNSFGGLMNRPAAAGAYLHRWHRDLRAFAAGDEMRLMINMLVTLDPFTAENGGTLLDLGSHRVAARSEGERRVAIYEAPAGSVLLFDSRLLHAAGANRSGEIRRALTLTFTPPFFKPQMDHVKQLGADRVAAASEALKRRLGWYARVPESLDDWYNAPEHRFYREDR